MFRNETQTTLALCRIGKLRFGHCTITVNGRKARPMWDHSCYEHRPSPRVFLVHSGLDGPNWASAGYDGAILSTADWSGANPRSAGKSRRGGNIAFRTEHGRAPAHQVQ